MTPTTPTESAIARAFAELDQCGNHTAEECEVLTKVFNRAMEIDASPGIPGPGSYGGLAFPFPEMIYQPDVLTAPSEGFSDTERDARRYRWLRVRIAGQDHVDELVEFRAEVGMETDAAIDAAISAESGGDGE